LRAVDGDDRHPRELASEIADLRRVGIDGIAAGNHERQPAFFQHLY
jgi:hypothetical protein